MKKTTRLRIKWHVCCTNYQQVMLEDCLDKKMREKIIRKRDYHRRKQRELTYS